MFEKLVAIEPVSLIPSTEEELHRYAKEVVLYRDVPASDDEMVRRIGDSDAVLLSSDAEFDESSLTGESLPVQRTEGGDLDPRYSTLAEMARVLGMDIIAVPSSLRPSLQAFIQSGGKFLGQPEGVDAPPSVVDGLRR